MKKLQGLGAFQALNESQMKKITGGDEGVLIVGTGYGNEGVAVQTGAGSTLNTGGIMGLTKHWASDCRDDEGTEYYSVTWTQS